MRSFAAVTALAALASTVLAAPSDTRDISVRSVEDYAKSAELTISELEAQSCDVLGE